jgi:IS605 OrfB family transposase
VIAVDLNADHLAVAETDRFGNLIDSFILPFNFNGLSTEQTEALLGDLSAVLVRRCEAKSKPLALENLDFEEKKKSLREQPKVHRGFLSAFAYSKFHEATRSRTRANGIELISVNPAYTSLIGAYKFQGLAISSHEKAALAIARRAQGFSEGLGVFQGTLPTQAMMSERTRFTASPRHVLGFYSDHRQIIRKLLIETDKRPIHPLNRALSLAKAHPSLQRSYFVTRERRGSEALRCASG